MNIRGLKALEFPKIIDMLETKASTIMGKELANNLLPSNYLHAVKELQEETFEAFEVIRLKGSMPLGGIKDIRSALARLRVGGDLTIEQLIAVSNTIYAGRKLKRFILNLADKEALPILAAHVNQIEDLKDIEDKINFCINEQGEVVDSASSELRSIRQQIKIFEKRIKDKLESIIRNSKNIKMLQDPIVTIRNGRYVIPVKQEYKSAFGGMIHDQSGSGATLFIEPEAVVQANNQLKEALIKEEKEIEKILRILSSVVMEEVESLTVNIEKLSIIDFIHAKAELAVEMKAVKPILNDRGYINLKKARHPLIPIDQVVAIDFNMGKDFDTVLITGPNTGGKTVSLKTVGLLTIMAMSGLHIPVEEESEISIFSSVFVDIGDEQSIEQSLSTFSGHLTNIINILYEIGNDSLVLLDELGAGTDPTEGAALAIAILEKIREIGAKVIATTHYSELKAYAYNHRDVVNASVEFNVETLRPTFRLLIGVPGRSNAFSIARRLGLAQEIIDFARQQINEDDQQVESMIALLEKNRSTTENERLQAEEIRKNIQHLNRELEEKLVLLERERYLILEEAKGNAEKIVKKARLEAEEVIKELRKLAKEEQTGIKEHRLIELKKQLEDTIPTIDKPLIKKQNKESKIEVGNDVKVLSYGQTGTVLEKIKENEYLIQIGIVKIKVEESGLEVIEKKKKEKEVNITGIKRDLDVKLELDVRGKNIEEAMMEIDRYLDEVFLQGYHQVSIIHGKGTGVLRAGLQDFLRKHTYVKQTRTGQYGEGGSGVTIIELK
ncbi:MAG: endonuclease MutS2 [Vulcanibacillus sp.]